MAMTITALLLGASLLLGPSPQGPVSPPRPGVPGLSPEVAALPASSAALDAARSELERATATRARDTTELASTRAALDGATVESTATSALVTRRRDQLTKLRAEISTHRAAIRALAIGWYVDGTADERSFDPTLGAPELVALRRQAVLGASASSSSKRALEFLEQSVSNLTDELDRLERAGERLGGRIDELTSRAQQLTAAVADDESTVFTATIAVTSARLNATVDGTDISTVALDAYWRAAALTRLTKPACAMTWWVLAGIGHVETQHGTYLGSSVAIDGSVTPKILGPPLDGTNGFRMVPDSDTGALDGDPLMDRAVGPMQFLPSTWRTVGRDGNGDGAADPNNIYDAALGAASYLCRSGSVADDAGMRRAFFSYNHSQAYVDKVALYALFYRDAVALPGVPGP